MRHLDVGVPVLSLRGQRAPLLLGVPYEWMCPCPAAAAAAAAARHWGRSDPEKTCPSPDDDEKEDDHEVEVVVKSHRRTADTDLKTAKALLAGLGVDSSASSALWAK